MKMQLTPSATTRRMKSSNCRALWASSEDVGSSRMTRRTGTSVTVKALSVSAVPSVAPLRSGIVVALAYALGAAFPVIPYALPVQVQTAFTLSVVCTLIALFVAGALKTLMTGRPWLRSGLETVLVGALAAAATFLAGRLVSHAA